MPAPVRVLASRAANRTAPVFDLTVEHAHEFFANGVLVHNSMDSARYAVVGRFGKLSGTVYRSTSLPPA